MNLRWLHRGIWTGGRVAALLSLTQCWAPQDDDPFADDGDSDAADSESSDSDESASEESTGDSSNEESEESSESEAESESESESDADDDETTTDPDSDSDSGPGTTSTSGSNDDDDDTSSSETTQGWPTAGNDTGDDSAEGGNDTTTSSDSGDADDGGPVVLDCDAPMPTSGAMNHSGNGRGGDGNLAWEIWSNTGRGELTTYDVPAFTASWNEAGGYLGRLGFEWGAFGDNPVPHEQVGTITAQFVSRKTGSAGVYSYVGMYGWTTDPCVEWYIVEDSYNNMPINPGSLDAGFGMPEVMIDDGTYRVYKRPTTGTGGTRCSGVTNWDQYYSVRTTARTCGEISLSEHFEAWEGLGLPMGNLLEAKILVEVGGGSGRVDLPIANVMVD